MKWCGFACKKRKAVASKAKLSKLRRAGPIDKAPLDGAQMRWLAQLRLKVQVCQMDFTKRLLLSLSQPLLKPVR